MLRHHRKRPNPRRLEKARRRVSAPRRHLKQLSRQFKQTRPRLRRHHKCRRRRKSMTARNELTCIDFIWWAQTDLAVLNKPALADL
jgi:hypothetical protein